MQFIFITVKSHIVYDTIILMYHVSPPFVFRNIMGVIFHPVITLEANEIIIVHIPGDIPPALVLNFRKIISLYQ